MKINLDLSGVSIQSSRFVAPTGNYPVETVTEELKETKAGGGMLIVGFKILSGEHKGKIVSNNYNTHNSNKDAEAFARRDIKTILTHGGHKNPDAFNDTEEILGLKLNIYIEEEANNWTNDQGEEIEGNQNKFCGYYPLDLEDVVEAKETKTKKKEKVKSDSPFTKTNKEEVKEAPTEPVEEEQKEATKKVFPWAK